MATTRTQSVCWNIICLRDWECKQSSSLLICQSLCSWILPGAAQWLALISFWRGEKCIYTAGLFKSCRCDGKLMLWALLVLLRSLWHQCQGLKLPLMNPVECHLLDYITGYLHFTRLYLCIWPNKMFKINIFFLEATVFFCFLNMQKHTDITDLQYIEIRVLPLNEIWS